MLLEVNLTFREPACGVAVTAGEERDPAQRAGADPRRRVISRSYPLLEDGLHGALVFGQVLSALERDHAQRGERQFLDVAESGGAGRILRISSYASRTLPLKNRLTA